jgi:hypothetical protein
MSRETPFILWATEEAAACRLWDLAARQRSCHLGVHCHSSIGTSELVLGNNQPNQRSLESCAVFYLVSFIALSVGGRIDEQLRLFPICRLHTWVSKGS